jgi:hypothetical protein
MHVHIFSYFEGHCTIDTGNAHFDVMRIHFVFLNLIYLSSLAYSLF